ncbi:acetolactate synthase large subunit [Chachezhania antarctica]|uniref:acetolactate synthase large subunit n=1 Tax=Chachezhania antarctica TaxID=2340860 RepID=UPI000EAE54CE|nr:acetolactate synthase large subunit [Chachezhania antarctica]|tara:strand:+ start:2386 stop:3936 length:1551 start_codon:yes stop_codon:yes gene_type:complete
MANGADVLCDTLLLNGVDVCFANPGTSEMHFVAALDRKLDMRCVLGLFEGVVTGAADGYARMAGKPAATLLHTGPGLANGLANMHNARRARSPMVNVVGDHAAYHLPYDAALTTDIEGLARPMSDYVRRIAGPDDVGAATAQAIAAAQRPPGGVSTLILPADASWGEPASAAPVRADIRAPSPPDGQRVAAAAAALRADGPDCVLLMSGAALRTEAIETAFAIAAATGCQIIAQQSNARIERGAGRHPVERVPYVVDVALKRFASTKRMILVGAKAPVAFFAYPGKPSSVVPDSCEVSVLAKPEDDLLGALSELGHSLGAGPAPAPAPAPMADLPSGVVTPQGLAIAVGRALPEEAILCDESITSGREFFGFTHGAAPHTHLQLTGGAIGEGLPLAVGAAIACPGRKVFALQADGSAMYTNQALWTMAREGLDVVVILLSNRRYAILRGELKAVGAEAPGRNAQRMLDLDQPAIDWVSLANGMGVEAARVETVDALADRLAAATAAKGPFLIELMI